MSKEAASVPSRLYSSVSAFASVAPTTAPTLVPAALFSATLRVSEAFANTGALFMAATATIWNTSESP